MTVTTAAGIQKLLNWHYWNILSSFTIKICYSVFLGPYYVILINFNFKMPISWNLWQNQISLILNFTIWYRLKKNKANKQKKARGQEMTRNDQHSYGKLVVIRFSTPKTWCFDRVFEMLDFPKNEKKPHFFSNGNLPGIIFLGISFFVILQDIYLSWPRISQDLSSKIIVQF